LQSPLSRFTNRIAFLVGQKSLPLGRISRFRLQTGIASAKERCREKGFRVKKSVAILVLLVLASPIGGFAAPVTPTGPATGQATSGPALVSLGELHAFAFTNKREYVVGEPVFLTLLLANWSQKSTFELQGYLHLANDFEVMVARSRELPKRFTAGLPTDAFAPGPTYVLRPREWNTLRRSLCYEPEHPSGFLFDQPGRYTIACKANAAVNYSPRVLTFPEIQIEIKEPVAGDLKALELIRRPDCAESLQELQIQGESAKIWQDLVARFPDSLWVPYAKLLLARQALEGEQSDYNEVAKQFEAILSDSVDFPLRNDLCYYCAMCQDRLGRPLETLRWLYRIQREYPLSPNIHASDRLFRKYIYQPGWEQRYAPWYLRE